MSDRHERLATLFGELCDRPPEQQARALAEIGAGDPELVRELAELLQLDAAKLIGPLLDRFGGAVSAVRSAVGLPDDRPALDDSDAFGGGRYRVVRKLGEGGLGIVYEVDDTLRGRRVALKTFRRPGSDAMFRLKREFRTLSGIEHPHLVTLYDLVVEDDRVFFTMELIDGSDALDYVRGDGDAPYDEAKLRRMLPQLAQGLAALHALGKLHRDIKPSNVRVASDGRVVLLDFGLAVDIGELAQDSLVDAVAGTLAYMSPEQARAERDLGPATDWYAFGVLLYEALTGALPFTGRPLELMAKKTQRVAPPPRQRRPDVPADLDALCCALLERDPSRRIRGGAVLEALGVSPGVDERLVQSSSTGGQTVTGRNAELDRLFAAFENVQHERRARVVVVSGPSGIGKSSLVAEFVRRLRRRHGDAVALRGRCYESEAVSYRAMDAVIDDLSRHWRTLPDLEAGYLCPEEPHLLPVLFPVLGRVAAVAQRRHQDSPSDPIERRDRAYAALRETFRKLAADHPTVMFVDDMQWADAESTSLLAELLRPPRAAALLVVLATRDADPGADTPLSGLLDRLGDTVETLPLPPLPADAGEAIAMSLLGSDAADAARRIAREADGNPFFLTELCRAASTPGATPGQSLTVDDLVRARVAALSENDREILELIAIAGQPVAEDVIETAAAVSPASFAESLRSLRAASLLRTAGGADDRAVECYHARVREAIVSRLPGERPAMLHRRVAQALEVAGNAPAERLVRHWQAAGDAPKAAAWAQRAVAGALDTLDFSRAAELIGVVLALDNQSVDERRRLLVQHGDALVEAGRPAEAATSFEEAIATAPPGEQIALRQRVVQQLLALGQLDRGLDAAAALTRSVGWRLPRTPFGTVLRILINAARLRLHGDDPKPRRDSDSALRTRFEVTTALARSVSLIDSLRGMVCSQFAALTAAGVREPDLRARSLAMRSMGASAAGNKARADRMLERATALASESGSPSADTYVSFARGFQAACVTADWNDAIARFDAAERSWREGGRGEGWIMDSVVMLSLMARLYRGDIRELNELVPQVTLQCARSGRRVVEVTLRARHALQTVLADQPEAALFEVDAALADWPDKRDRFLLQHMFGLVTTLHAELHRGRPDAATSAFASDGPLLRRSLLLRVVPFAVEFVSLQGRIELSHAARGSGSARAKHQRRALAFARRLDRAQTPLSRAYADVLRAGAAHLDGDSDSELTALRAALSVLDATHTGVHAACVRRRLGRTLGGDEGTAMVAEADVWLAQQGIAHPGRATAALLGGWALADA